MMSLRDALAGPPDPVLDEVASTDLELPESDAVVMHPDGFYWVAPDGHQQFGPFATAADALADMIDNSDEGIEPCETLQEAERDLGIADWVDPDTGEPAEDTSGRFEDH